MTTSRVLSLGVLACSVSLACDGNATQKQPEPAPITAANSSPNAVTGALNSAIAGPGTVVILDPVTPRELPVKREPAIMDQAGYQFLPPFLVAQVGQTVQFRNSEDVLHNVRVTEVEGEKPVFNVATIAFGIYDHKFERPGFYVVGCDIHSTMRADILVTASPYTAKSGDSGVFNIADVPPGAYTLTVYGAAGPVVRAVEIKAGRTDLGAIQ
jgi:plastocyanin